MQTEKIYFDRDTLDAFLRTKRGLSLDEFRVLASALPASFPVDWLYAVALAESGFVGTALNSDTGAKGYFQGIDDSWQAVLSNVPKDHLPMVKRMMQVYKPDVLLTFSYMYMMHHFGTGAVPLALRTTQCRYLEPKVVNAGEPKYMLYDLVDKTPVQVAGGDTIVIDRYAALQRVLTKANEYGLDLVVEAGPYLEAIQLRDGRIVPVLSSPSSLTNVKFLESTYYKAASGNLITTMSVGVLRAAAGSTATKFTNFSNLGLQNAAASASSRLPPFAFAEAVINGTKFRPTGLLVGDPDSKVSAHDIENMLDKVGHYGITTTDGLKQQVSALNHVIKVHPNARNLIASSITAGIERYLLTSQHASAYKAALIVDRLGAVDARNTLFTHVLRWTEVNAGGLDVDTFKLAFIATARLASAILVRKFFLQTVVKDDMIGVMAHAGIPWPLSAMITPISGFDAPSGSSDVARLATKHVHDFTFYAASVGLTRLPIQMVSILRSYIPSATDLIDQL